MKGELRLARKQHPSSLGGASQGSARVKLSAIQDWSTFTVDQSAGGFEASNSEYWLTAMGRNLPTNSTSPWSGVGHTADACSPSLPDELMAGAPRSMRTPQTQMAPLHAGTSGTSP